MAGISLCGDFLKPFFITSQDFDEDKLLELGIV
jgi:hypothetical protein